MRSRGDGKEVLALAPDGRPVIGAVGPASLLLFGRRLAAAFSNWPSILSRLLLASLRSGRGEIVSRARTGALVVSPRSRPAWWPVFEMLAEDLYRLEEVGGLELVSGDVILDLGAHLGAAAIVLSRRWPEAQLVCVEPNPSTFSYLERNIAGNEIPALLLNEAVGASDGTTRLYGAELASCEASTSFSRPGESIEVSVAAFSRLMAEAPGPVRVVKLDCEGAEHELLAASTPELWKEVDLVLLEYHQTGDLASSWEGIEERLGNLGFVTHWHMPFSWRPGLGMAALGRP